MRRTKNFGSQSTELITICKGILSKYRAMGIRVTLRQLYYQLVSRDIIANNQKEYAKIGRLMTDARYAGYISWSSIEDRVRIPYKHIEFENLSQLIDTAAANYRLDRWKDQTDYVELWTEKDAISSVIKPIADKHHVYLSVNRGYSSASAMHEAFQRFRDKDEEGKLLHILYLGDHDPSGLDMVRDIEERLEEFGVVVDIEHIALTMDQVQEYDPPPNPAKITDPRAKMYILEHGDVSWEVDALQPNVMMDLIDGEISSFIDKIPLAKVIRKENEDLKKMRSSLNK